MKFAHSISAAILIVLTSLPVFAGNEGSGGGDAFICPDGVYLADTYAVRQRLGTIQNGREIPLSAAKVLQVALRSIRREDAELARELSGHLAGFTFVPVTQLEELNDDDIRDVPRGCVKRQLAVQNLATGQIRYRQDLHDRMSATDQGLFRLHEAHIKHQSPAQVAARNTTKVRSEVASLATSAPFAWFAEYTIQGLALFPDGVTTEGVAKLFKVQIDGQCELSPEVHFQGEYTAMNRGHDDLLHTAYKKHNLCPIATTAVLPTVVYHSSLTHDGDWLTTNSAWATNDLYLLVKNQDTGRCGVLQYRQTSRAGTKGGASSAESTAREWLKPMTRELEDARKQTRLGCG